MGIQLTLVPTNKFVSHRGCVLRLWEGVSSHGHRIKALVEHISSDPDETLPGLLDASRAEYDGVEWVDRDEATEFEVDDGN